MELSTTLGNTQQQHLIDWVVTLTNFGFTNYNQHHYHHNYHQLQQPWRMCRVKADINFNFYPRSPLRLSPSKLLTIFTTLVNIHFLSCFRSTNHFTTIWIWLGFVVLPRPFSATSTVVFTLTIDNASCVTSLIFLLVSVQILLLCLFHSLSRCYLDLVVQVVASSTSHSPLHRYMVS